MTEPIPDDVRRFVLACIPSVPFLEAVLLFHGAPAREFALEAIAAALYITAERAQALLDALVAAGFVALAAGEGAAPRWRHAPRDDALAHGIDRLAEVYPKHLIAITNLIHDLNARSSQRFADAFKLRKDT